MYHNIILSGAQILQLSFRASPSDRLAVEVKFGFIAKRIGTTGSILFVLVLEPRTSRQRRNERRQLDFHYASSYAAPFHGLLSGAHGRNTRRRLHLRRYILIRGVSRPTATKGCRNNIRRYRRRLITPHWWRPYMTIKAVPPGIRESAIRTRQEAISKSPSPVWENIAITPSNRWTCIAVCSALNGIRALHDTDSLQSLCYLIRAIKLTMRNYSIPTANDIRS